MNNCNRIEFGPILFTVTGVLVLTTYPVFGILAILAGIAAMIAWAFLKAIFRLLSFPWSESQRLRHYLKSPDFQESLQSVRAYKTSAACVDVTAGRYRP